MEPWIIALLCGIGVVVIAAIVLIIDFVVLKGNNKPKHIKVDDERFTNNLINLLGGKDNIEEVTVDNGRLKFQVADLDTVDLEGIKTIATSGVFVTGNIIKTLFKLDSQIIKKALDNIL
jgi:phosphotransferase system IIB component